MVFVFQSTFNLYDGWFYQRHEGHEHFAQTLFNVVGRLDGEREEEDDPVVGLVDDVSETDPWQVVEVGGQKPNLSQIEWWKFKNIISSESQFLKKIWLSLSFQLKL